MTVHLASRSNVTATEVAISGVGEAGSATEVDFHFEMDTVGSLEEASKT